MLTILNSILRIFGILGGIVSCCLWLDTFRISCHNMEKLVCGGTKDSNDT